MLKFPIDRQTANLLANTGQGNVLVRGTAFEDASRFNHDSATFMSSAVARHAQAPA